MPNNISVGAAFADPALAALYVNAPVTKTASFTLGERENFVVCNGSGAITVTLPQGAEYIGRVVVIKTIAAQAVNSSRTNVRPIASATLGTAIVAGTAGLWAMLVCEDGNNWTVMAS